MSKNLPVKFFGRLEKWFCFIEGLGLSVGLQNTGVGFMKLAATLLCDFIDFVKMFSSDTFFGCR